jgi:hypothetical protein
MLWNGTASKGVELKPHRFVALASLLAVLAVACSLSSRFPQLSDVPVPSPTLDAASSQAPASTVLLTADPALAGINCLANTWEITGLNDYIVAAIPPEMAAEYNLEYQGTNGSAFFILSPDGRITLQADQLELLFEARVAVLTVPVTVSLDGEAVGSYAVDGATLTTSGMDTSGLTVSARALNSDIVPPAQIISAIPLLSPPFNAAEYTCTGDALQLMIAAYPEGVPPLVFQKAAD